MKRIFLCLALLQISITGFAQVDCSPLDPRVSVSTEREGKINIALGTLYKVAKIDGGIEGKLKTEIRNLQQGTETVSESLAVAARAIYLFCGMVANAKDLSTERKFQLFNSLQATMRDPKIEQPGRRDEAPSQNKPAKTNTGKSYEGKIDNRAGWAFRGAVFGRSCEYSWDLVPQNGVKLRLEASTSIAKGLRFGVVFSDSSLFSGKFFEIRDLNIDLFIDGSPSRLKWESGIPDERGVLGLSVFDYFWSIGQTASQYESRQNKLASAKTLSVTLSAFGKKYRASDISVAALKERIQRRECPYPDVSAMLNAFASRL
jgi:hypothetical protein